MVKVLIVYDSKTGNAAKLGEVSVPTVGTPKPSKTSSKP